MDDLEKRLYRAVDEGDLLQIKQLLNNGIDFTEKYDQIVRIASEKGHLDIIKYLVSLGCDVTTGGNNAVLDRAVKASDKELIKFLVDRGADVNMDESLPLRWLSYVGNEDAVNYLLSKGANQTAKSNEAIKDAIRYENTGILDILLSDLNENHENSFNALLSEIKLSRLGYSSQSIIKKILLDRKNENIIDVQEEALAL